MCTQARSCQITGPQHDGAHDVAESCKRKLRALDRQGTDGGAYPFTFSEHKEYLIDVFCARTI